MAFQIGISCIEVLDDQQLLIRAAIGEENSEFFGQIFDELLTLKSDALTNAFGIKSCATRRHFVLTDSARIVAVARLERLKKDDNVLTITGLLEQREFQTEDCAWAMLETIFQFAVAQKCTVASHMFDHSYSGRAGHIFSQLNSRLAAARR